MKAQDNAQFLLGCFFYFLLLLSQNAFADEQSDPQAISDPAPPKQQFVYLVSDINIPFWQVMANGIQSMAKPLGYELTTYSANNDAKRELELTFKAIQDKVDGIILSPTTSSAAATILKLTEKAEIPVVIADIGADNDHYVSYISSDNKNGAYHLGKLLTSEMTHKGWESGSVGIIAIPQKRENGQARTAGFMKALEEAGIKGAGILQQVNFSYNETYQFSMMFIEQHPNLRALWLQGSSQYQAALDAIKGSGKEDEILLICFDAEPEFLTLIPQRIIVGAAMQQPYLIGQEAMLKLDRHLKGESVAKEVKLPIMVISPNNIAQKLPVIKRNVLTIEPNK